MSKDKWVPEDSDGELPFAQSYGHEADGLTEDNRERLVRSAIDEIRSSGAGLRMDYLGRCIVSADTATTRAGLSHGADTLTLRACQPTGLVTAVHLAEEDVLIVHPSFLGLCLSPDPEENEAAIAMLHHEICKCHEHAIRVRRDETPATGHRVPFWQVAVSMWQEYFASRRTSTVWPGVPDMGTAVLPVLFYQTHQDLSKLVEEYRQSADKDAFLDGSTKVLDGLVRRCGFTLGALAAGDYDLQTVDRRASNAVEGTCLGRFWSSWAKHLDDVYQSFTRERPDRALEQLAQSVGALLECVGCRMWQERGIVYVQLG